MIVLDTSAAIDLVLAADAAAWLEAALDDAAWRVSVPHLYDVEAVATLRRLAAAGVLTDQAATSALRVLVELPSERHAHALLVERMWALRPAMTAADAAFVALAEALDAPLLTTDRRLARAHGHRARLLSPA